MFSFLTSCDSTNASESSEGLLCDVLVEDENKDQDTITEEEKQSTTENSMLGASGTKVNTYDGYLGYGYNILTSAYYNHKDINTSHPVIDMDSLAKEGNVYIEKKASQLVKGQTFVSSSTREYSHTFATAASASTDIGFTGSFEASFNMSHTFQMNSNQKLITTQALLETQNDYILDSDADLLAAHVTDAFKKAVVEKTPEELIAIYGTHVLSNISLGGRFDLNYFYTRTETNEDTDITVSASASYNCVKGSTSEEDKKNKKEIDENSKIYINVYGGPVTVDPTSIEAAVSSYKDWSAGVEKGEVTFVNASEITSLWDIIAALDIEDAAKKSEKVKTCFDTSVTQISSEFKDTVPTYISEILIGYGDSQVKAKNMLRKNGVSDGHIVNLDLNKNAGGSWVYLGYKTTSDKSLAITDIIADYYNKKRTSDINYNDHKYTIIPVDLNKGAKGKFIYIYYTKSTDFDPITEIKYQDQNTFQYGKSDGFNAVCCVADGNVLDFNNGSSGGDYICLWFKRTKDKV